MQDYGQDELSDVLWRMDISPDNLRRRAAIIAQIRHFFAHRDVLEVDVPVLSQFGVTDPHLSNFVTPFTLGNKVTPLYLQTSPEYGMKRMLASGSGCIYYMGKSFRHEDAGHQHNPEFTMLEWYRIGFDDHALMLEVDALLQGILNTEPADKMTYHEAFLQFADIDINHANKDDLIAALAIDTHYDLSCESIEHILQLIFNLHIEPNIGGSRPCFVYDFPASQAALARLKADEPGYAHRFEVYYKGLELANGYWELTDPKEQAQRFAKDNRYRDKLGLPNTTIDTRLMAALNAGLPDCAGVALGVDRLIMLALGKKHINDVLSFGIDRA